MRTFNEYSLSYLPDVVIGDIDKVSPAVGVYVVHTTENILIVKNAKNCYRFTMHER